MQEMKVAIYFFVERMNKNDAQKPQKGTDKINNRKLKTLSLNDAQCS